MIQHSNPYRIERGIQRGKEFIIYINGKSAVAYPGETIATVLMANGIRAFRHTLIKGEPRGLYCGMGICYECMVTFNHRPNIRACQTLAQPEDVVEI